MIIIKLPINRLSRCMLLAEYGIEPLHLSSHDLLFQQLCYKRVVHKNNFNRLERSLNSHIEICVNNSLAKRIKIHGEQLGYHLYAFHRRIMMNYIEAQTAVGVKARYALQNFYMEYGITEDDFDQDTAYKYWQRHKKQKQLKIIWTKKQATVVLNYKKVKATETISIPLDDETINLIIEKFQVVYIGQVKNPPARILKHLSIYLKSELGCKRISYISAREKLPRSSIYYAVNKIKIYLSTDHLIRESLNQCYEDCLSSYFTDEQPNKLAYELATKGTIT